MNSRQFVKRILTFVLPVCVLSLTSGCEMYDWLCSRIETAFSNGFDYKVSVVDCKNFKKPDAVFPITPEKLSARLSTSIREGVDQLGTTPKFQNIERIDAIPVREMAAFQDALFSDQKTYDEKLIYLKGCAERYGSNILMWSATMGDDSEMAFVGFLYRKDLHVISDTGPQVFKSDMSERVQEALVRDATIGLLEKSLDGKPIGPVGDVVKDLRTNKEAIIATGTAILVGILNEALAE